MNGGGPDKTGAKWARLAGSQTGTDWGPLQWVGDESCSPMDKLFASLAGGLCAAARERLCAVSSDDLII